MAEQKFRLQSGIVFPDGTEQSTAYTGAVPGGPLFVVVNRDGNVSTSEDGVTWTDAVRLTFGGDLVGEMEDGADKVALAETYVVYIATSESSPSDQLWYASAPGVSPTLIVIDETNEYTWNDIAFGDGITVAVGRVSLPDPEDPGNFLTPIPTYAFTTNGTDWTVLDQESTDGYTESFAGSDFTSVVWNGTGWFIAAGDSGDNAGAFFISGTLTDSGISPETYIPFVNNGLEAFPDISSVVWTGNRWWLKDANETGYVFVVSDGANPLTATWSVVDTYDAVIASGFGAGSEFYEVTGGTIGSTHWFVMASNQGQVLASSDGGDTFTASVPLPYTGEIASVTQATTAVLTITGFSPTGDSEKIVITEANPSDWNGTYYLNGAGEGAWELYSDAELTTPVNSTGYAAYVDSAVITFTHGQYIDSLGFGLGKFIVGNDNEELFTSTNLSTWTLVNDQDDNGFDYWNDIDFNANWGASGGSAVDLGDITFEGVKIIGAEGGERAGLISLVPSKTGTVGLDSWNFEDYGQFIDIYPTNAFDVPHIHIAAGSGPESAGDLMLGDDNTYVEINHNGYIGIESYNSDTSDYHYWRFDVDGILTIPSQISAETGQALRLFTTDAEIHLMKNPTTDIGIGLQTSGNNVEITTSGNSWQFGEDGSLVTPGNIEFPNGGYIEDSEGFFLATDNSFQIQTNKTAGQIDFTFGSNGTLTLPGAVVNSTVAKTGADINGNDVLFEVTAVDGGVVTEITVTNSPNPAWISGTSGLALDDIDFTVSFDGVGNASVTVNNGGTGHSIGETFVLFPAAVGGTTPTPTALDLAKTVNILSSGGDYSLADGAEGQIMYFVPASGLTSDVYVEIANARIMGEGPVEETDYRWTPFFGESLVPTTIAMAIFADGAWCLRGGTSD